MKLLIAVSSKHGSTREIAAAIAETVREAGIVVEVVDAEQVESVDPYDAVIVGSAVYLGRWMGPARALVKRCADALRRQPVWLFSSGPLGRDIVDPADAAEGLKLLELVGAREHRVFAGKADKHEFGFLERRMVSLVKSPYGDHRDWPAIRAWATSIAGELTAVPAGAR
ncbi:MAG: flavodoxin domain-containing protein [Candidatus Limnocylindrales bacterium]